jgi:tRNA A-37 threonylcarbamoyl transferase component Bud32
MSEFDRWWLCRGETVEPFNERRGGQSGVERVIDPNHGTVYVKRQLGHTFRSLRYPLGIPTAIRERDAYLAFKKIGINTPVLIFAEARKQNAQWQAILATKDLAGFTSLEHWYRSGGPARLGVENYRRFLESLGYTLGRLHRERWCHGGLHFLHIYINTSEASQLPTIAFLDLERAQQLLTRQRAANRDLRTLRRRAPRKNGTPLLNDEDWSVLLAAHHQALMS